MPGAGGRLVVVERSGRLGKQFPLVEGLATLGRGAACDVRLLLPQARPHHATLALHELQAVIRNVSDGETFVNGKSISVAALRHNDIITIGDRSLRWEYDDPTVKRPAALETVATGRGGGRGRLPRRQTAAGEPSARPPSLQLALELQHRASMPGGAGGKQVAIVQPQRRDTSERPNESAPRSTAESPRPARGVGAEGAQGAPAVALQPPTKATLWIESRKSGAGAGGGPRRSAPGAGRKQTPLRLAVLRRARAKGRASAPGARARVAKIEAPSEIDPTKQAAIMLMTGHAARARSLPAPPSPASRRSTRGTARGSVSIVEITDSDAPSGPAGSPLPASPRKSALRNPAADRGGRKTESIKFDLSNLGSPARGRSSAATDASREDTLGASASEDDLMLRYSDASAKSPSPRRAIHSRSSRILEKLGASLSESVSQRSATSESPRARKSLRGSLIVREALGESRRSASSSTPSPRPASSRTRSLSPRSTTRNSESYSIVDLVSMDSTESNESASMYDSVGSTRSSSVVFGTPRPSAGRRTRSTVEPALLGSSTPYAGRAARSRSSPVLPSAKKSSPNESARISIVSTRSKSLTTPENTRKHISVNSTRISRASRSKSRINDSDLHMMSSKLDMDTTEGSPKSSRISRANITLNSPPLSQSRMQNYSREDTHVSTILADSSQEGTLTPENRHSPEAAGTPVLSIQSLLNSSRSSLSSELSQRKDRFTRSLRRKTIGVIRPESKKSRSSIKSKSFVISARKSKRSTRSSPQDENTLPNDNEEIVTPKSSVKLVQEAVKNKHSTAKKPQSKRSIIDDLNESDIVKQLFNSPVKRKLSQSMTEFSRRHLFDDDVIPKRPTRNTMAGTGRTFENSVLEATGDITPEMFVSPLDTPSGSPDLTGVKRLFQRTSPADDLRDVRGVKRLLRTPRKSVRNDLTDVFGVKAIFARSPANRLSDVRIKGAFVAGPENDLRDVRGVRSLFGRRSAADDLRDVSGVKRALQRGSPRNDLRDVSGVGELFRSRDDSVDLLLGGPATRAVHSKSFPARGPPKSGSRRVKSFRADAIAVDVAAWPRPERAAKELRKLATATVEGSAPLRASRARGSTAGGARRSEHTLPLKKRSLERLPAPLPLKKRSVPHSTPLKGRRGPDMDGSDLGRVSPILGRADSFRAQPQRSGDLKGRREPEVVVVENRSPEKPREAPRAKTGRTAEANTNDNTSRPGAVGLKSPRRATRRTAVTEGGAGIEGRKSKARVIQTRAPKNSSQKTPVESRAQRAGSTAAEAPAPRGGRATEAKSAVDTRDAPLEKPSPKRTRRAKIRAEPPQPAETTGSERANGVETTTEVPNTKRRRKSLVITEKPPVMSPQPARSTRRARPSSPEAAPAATGRRRRVAAAAPPKSGRAELVTKASPEPKPPAARTRGAEGAETPPRPRTAGRRAGAARKEKESPEKTPTRPKRKGGRRNASATEIAPEAKRTRKTPEDSSESQTGRGRGTRNTKVEALTSVDDPPKSEGKKVAARDIVQRQSTRGKKKVAPDSEETRNEKSRKVGAREIVESEKGPSTRSTRAGRKRKSAEEPAASSAKVAKKETAEATRGRKAEPADDAEGRSRTKLAQEKAESSRRGERGGRARKSPKAAKEPAPRKAAKQEDEKTTRGRKTRGQAQASAAVAAPPAAATRSRRGRR